MARHGKMPSYFVFALAILMTVYSSNAPKSVETYTQLYRSAVASYMSERWYECATNIRKAVEDYKTYRNRVAECRISCGKTSRWREHYKEADVAFFNTAIRVADCTRKCREKEFPGRTTEVDLEVELDFQRLAPYDYWQMCAYKLNKYTEAASAAYTFSVHNPSHEQMQANLQFYRGLPQVMEEDFVDLEELPNQASFREGRDAYNAADWPSTIKLMERAVREYLHQTDICEAICEMPAEPEQEGDLYSVIANKYIKSLRCKMDCPAKVATADFTEPRDFLPEHFHYLQFAYYKMNNLAAAAQSVATFELFKPNDPIMSQNKGYYTQMGGITADMFRVRKEVSDYHNRQYSQAQVLVYGERSYLDMGTTQTETDNDRFPQPVYLPKDAAYEERMAHYRDQGVTMVMEAEELEGDHRVLFDGLLSQAQCDQLIELVNIGAKQGDGYGGVKRPSPHTYNEKFEGLTVHGAAELAQAGRADAALVEEYLRSSEYARNLLNVYYNLENPMYFHYTHLVKRTAIEGEKQKNRDDLSHPVHADNCYIQPDGTCLKQPPAYVDRDFSGLLYLNDDFEGGDFFFAHDNQTVHKRVTPKCGRFVGFPASHYHAVLGVTKGKRYAVAMWFTLNQAEQETNHAVARTILRQMEKHAPPKKNEKLDALLEAEGYTIRARETELNGPERFSADGLLSQEQCQTLMNLANDHALVGDGYRVEGKSSPFTDHETFAGITVDKAADLVAANQASKEDVQLYLDTAEIGRHLVETYFNLKTPLYFDYTHLACRTAHKADSREDLSHPIHSDNCIIRPDGSCDKIRPAYIQRDYSALIYLNEDFKGGEFFFAHKNRSVQSSVEPYCGLVVGFNAGNFHGVKAVEEGQRCAVALWFTLDQRFSEEAFSYATDVMSNQALRPKGPTANHGEL